MEKKEQYMVTAVTDPAETKGPVFEVFETEPEAETRFDEMLIENSGTGKYIKLQRETLYFTGNHKASGTITPIKQEVCN